MKKGTITDKYAGVGKTGNRYGKDTYEIWRYN